MNNDGGPHPKRLRLLFLVLFFAVSVSGLGQRFSFRFCFCSGLGHCFGFRFPLGSLSVSVSFSVCFFVGCGLRKEIAIIIFFINSGREKDKVEENYEAEDCQTLPTPPEEIHT